MAPCDVTRSPAITSLLLRVDPDAPVTPGTASVTAWVGYSDGTAEGFGAVAATLTLGDDVDVLSYSSTTSDTVHLLYASNASTEPVIDITFNLPPTQFSTTGGDPFGVIVPGYVKVGGVLYGPGYDCLVEMDSVLTIGQLDVVCAANANGDGICDPCADIDEDGVCDTEDACVAAEGVATGMDGDDGDGLCETPCADADDDGVCDDDDVCADGDDWPPPKTPYGLREPPPPRWGTSPGGSRVITSRMIMDLPV